VSDDAGDDAQAPEDAGEAFRKRQLDAQFTVIGPAPAWALKWPGAGKSPAGPGEEP
jgi:hypothetical protein